MIIEQALSRKYGISIVIPSDHQLICSLGIAVHRKGPVDLDMLIRMADQALFQVKANGKNTYHLRYSEVDTVHCATPLDGLVGQYCSILIVL